VERLPVALRMEEVEEVADMPEAEVEQTAH
jgi:hypothetical protein